MQKKLIALAVAGVLAAPLAAQAADAEVYGKMRLSVGIVGNDDQNVNNEDSKLSLSSHASRLGVRGSEDVGGGTMFSYQLETTVNIDEAGSHGIWGGMRDSYVGVGGESWGEARFGRLSTPYKIATGKLDPFGDTYADYNAVIDAANDLRSDNVIAYISPNMSGFLVAAAYATDAVDDNLVDTTDSTAIGGTTREQPAISLAGIYDNGTFFGSLAYQSIQESGTAVGTTYEDTEATKIGLGYNWGSGNVGFVYEGVDAGGPSADQDNTYIAVDQGFGGGMSVQLAYGMKDDVGNTADSGATFFAIGGKMEHTETVETYILYTQIDSDQNATYNLAGVGAAGSPEASASAFALGVNMKFSSL